MNNLKNLYGGGGMGRTIFAAILTLFLLFGSFSRGSSSSVEAKPFAPCAAVDTECAKQRAILRRLEKMRPSRKVTSKQIISRIKAACGKMRNLDCPELQNYQPTICFTDF